MISAAVPNADGKVIFYVENWQTSFSSFETVIWDSSRIKWETNFHYIALFARVMFLFLCFRNFATTCTPLNLPPEWEWPGQLHSDLWTPLSSQIFTRRLLPHRPGDYHNQTHPHDNNRFTHIRLGPGQKKSVKYTQWSSLSAKRIL